MAEFDLPKRVLYWYAIVLLPAFFWDRHFRSPLEACGGIRKSVLRLGAHVCGNARESCPVFPGHSNRIHKAFENPAALQGTEEERLVLFRRVRDEISGLPEGLPLNT